MFIKICANISVLSGKIIKNGNHTAIKAGIEAVIISPEQQTLIQEKTNELAEMLIQQNMNSECDWHGRFIKNFPKLKKMLDKSRNQLYNIIVIKNIHIVWVWRRW